MTWSQQVGQQLGGAGGAIDLDREIPGIATDLRGNGVSEHVRTQVLVVQPASGAVLGEPVGDVEVLFEVMPQRNVDERTAGGGQLHARGESTLDDREVTRREVPVQVRDEV